MADFILKLTDTVSIKGYSAGSSPKNMLASDILDFGVSNNYGNAFMLLDAGSGFNGLLIRYFNITGDTIYLATANYINYNSYIGVYAPNNAISTLNNNAFNYNGSGIGGASVAINFTNRTVDGIVYNCNGGNTAGYASQQAVYIPETITNIYIDGEPIIPPVQSYTSNGGGATHIAKVTGQLKDLSSNLSDILMVSGGGGGGLLIGETEYAGADAGGIAGNGINSADQTTGYAFGQGESGTDVSGGGGGLYGGYKGVIS